MGHLSSFLKRWLPPIVWMGVILGFSSDAFSASQTSRFIAPLLKWLLPKAGPETIELLHGLVRKAGHLIEYAVLAALLFHGFRDGFRQHWDWRWAARSLLIVLACAGVDEYRQTLTTARSGSVSDVFIDLTGAALALGIIYFIHRSRGKKQQSREHIELTPP